MAELRSSVNPLFLREVELRQGIELLFFAYRDFTTAPDKVLAERGMGRAHHRAIHFVGRNPGIAVGELLGFLKITKQSLGRVLTELTRQDLIVQKPGATDRRQRLLTLTEAGVALERRLSEGQRMAVARAYREAGAEAVEGFRNVLLGLVDEREREILRRQFEDERGGAERAR